MSSVEISHNRHLGVGGMAESGKAPRRVPLNRDRVLRAAVALADDVGIDALSMRNLAEQLGVVPMAIYKHVANKEELLDGMVEVIIGEIDPPAPGADWKEAIRQRILSARRVAAAPPLGVQVIESRTPAAPVVLDYMNSLIGMFRAGGFSADLTHQVMHALGSRMWGFTQEVFPRPPPRMTLTCGGDAQPTGRAVPYVMRDRRGRVARGRIDRGSRLRRPVRVRVRPRPPPRRVRATPSAGLELTDRRPGALKA